MRAALEPLLDRIGITRVADVTWLDDLGVPVVQAVRPTARTLAVSQGKGLTRDAAWVSAVMEAIELWHAEQVVPQRLASTAELAGELTYDPADLVLVDGSLYGPHVRLGWVPARRLPDGQPTWAPVDAVRLDATTVYGWSAPTFLPSTNGLGAGMERTAATLHALHEVLERDALLLSSRRPARPLDLAAVRDPTCNELVARLTRDGSTVQAFDISVDGLPCVAVELARERTALVHHGSALHDDLTDALVRALLEAAQSRLTDVAGARDDVTAAVYLGLAADAPTVAAAPVGPLPTRPRPGGTDWAARARLPAVPARLDRAVRAAITRFGTAPIAVDLDGPLGPAGPAVVKVLCPGAGFDPGVLR